MRFSALAAAVLLRRQKGKSAPLIDFNYHHHGHDWVMGQCGTRDKPSPLDLLPSDGVGKIPGKLPARYQKESTFSLVSDGHAVHLDLENQGLGGLTWDNAWFNLMYVKLHAPGEHTYNGQRPPVELQLVHKRWDTNALAIISVPFAAPAPPALNGTVNATNGTGVYERPDPTLPGYDPVLEVFTDMEPPQPGQQVQMRLPLPWDINKLVSGNVTGVLKGAPEPLADAPRAPGAPPIIPPSLAPTVAPMPTTPPPGIGAGPPHAESRSIVTPPAVPKLHKAAEYQWAVPPSNATYFQYTGSLTTPPCTSSVVWFVRQKPRSASHEQIELLTALSRQLVPEGNYRESMPRPKDLEVLPLVAVEAEPPLTAALVQQPQEIPADEYKTRGEAAALNWGKQAALQALKHAGQLKDLDQRLRKAMFAHSAEIAPQPPARPVVGQQSAVPDGFAAQYTESVVASLKNSVQQAVGELAQRVHPQTSAQEQADSLAAALPPAVPVA